MRAWTQCVSLVVASIFFVGQAVPVAYAHRTLRPEATGDSGTTQREIGSDTAWVYGAAGADMSALGRANLVSLGKRIVAGAFSDGRAFPIVGHGARPIDELVEAYALKYQSRFGTPLPQADKIALTGRLQRVKDGLERAAQEVQWRQGLRSFRGQFGDTFVEPPVLEAARFVPILDEAGTPALVNDGVIGTPTHQALIAYGGAHQYDGWAQATEGVAADIRERLGAKSAYLSLALVEGMLDQGEEGFNALKLKLQHEVNDLIYGRHRAESQEVEDTVNTVIGSVIGQFEQQQAARWADQLKQRKEAARRAAGQLATRVQLTPYLMDLGRFFAGGKAPEYVIQAIQAGLAQAAQGNRITDSQVTRYGRYVLLEAHSNGPQRNPEVDRLVVDLITETLKTQAPSGVNPVALTDAYAKELADQPYRERAEALRIRTGTFAFNERGAEPIYVSMALGGGPAAYNWVIMRLLDEAVQNQLKIEGTRDAELRALQREYERYRQARDRGDEALAEDLDFNAANLARQAELEGPGYVVVVESVEDILAGKRDRRGLRFVFPTLAPYIHTLVDNQTKWVITKVLPRPGSRLYDTSKAPEDQDPMLSVMVDQIGDATQDGSSFNPVFVAKQQSGAPAIGEFVSATTQFYLTTSGPGAGTAHRGVIPATQAEADAGTFADRGLIQMVSYTYQSFRNGRIPHSEVYDEVDVSTDVKATREDGLWVHDNLMLLGSFQPAMTAREAVQRAEHAAETLGGRYQEIPAALERDAQGEQRIGPDGKPIVRLDPILEASNRNQVLTVSSLKADIGATGHQVPYNVYYAAFRASHKVARQQGLLGNFDVANQGDDNNFVLFHKKGVNDPDIHALAFYTFFRAGWVAQQLGYKPYGFMQDFVDPKILEVIRRGELYRHANLTDEFIQALEEEIRLLPEGARWEEIRQGYENFKQGKTEGRLVEFAAPGNVTGMGIGFGEKAVSARELEMFPQVSVVGNDKGAAGAFNYPVYVAALVARLIAQRHDINLSKIAQFPKPLALRIEEKEIEEAFVSQIAEWMPDVPEAERSRFANNLLYEVNQKLSPEEIANLANYLEHGVVFETWDVLPNSRAFVDADSEDATLRALLSAQNVHNIKRIWTKRRAGWINDLTSEEVAAIERRADEALSPYRTEFEQRRTQLQRDVEAHKVNPREGRALETLNPWERMLHDHGVEAALQDFRPRLIEFYKVREFLGDDYFAAISTEKLAAVTGGEYVGKDDSVMITIEPFAKLYRAVRKVAIGVNIGNARGSHWVAIRPEGARTRVPGQIVKAAVAVKWSNPIEIALRYAVQADGSVVVDPATGLAAGEDMYGAPEYDAQRKLVAQFNEEWIGAQGGFSPHGPDVDRDIEAAYPAKATERKITAPNSPFAVPVSDTTLAVVNQGELVAQFPAMANYVVRPEVVEQAADLSAHRVILVHSSVYTQAPDAAIAQERIQGQIHAALKGGQSALHFALVVDGASTPEEAEQAAEALFTVLPEASRQVARLERGDFDLVVPAAVEANALFGLLEATFGKNAVVGSAVGPRAWVQAVKDASASPEVVGAIAFEPAQEAGKVARGAEAIIAGVEAAVAAGQLKPELAAKLDVLEEAGLLIPSHLDIAPEMLTTVRHYQTTVDEALAGV